MTKGRKKVVVIDASIPSFPNVVETTVEEVIPEEELVLETSGFTELPPVTELSLPEQGLLEIELVEVVEETPEEPKLLKQYTICPFCQNEDYKQHGSDEGSSWCTKCGKCFEINWHEE